MASHCISSFASEIGTFLGMVFFFPGLFLKYHYELIGGLAQKHFLSLIFSLGFISIEPYPSPINLWTEGKWK